MKKLVSVVKILLLTIVFVLGTTNRCFADIYVDPMEEYFEGAISILIVLLIVLLAIFIIALVCMLIAKNIIDSEDLFKKSKTICENLLYYILLILGLISTIRMVDWSYILVKILSLIAMGVSLFLRLKSKNKKASYIVLGVYLGLTLFVVLLEIL